MKARQKEKSLNAPYKYYEKLKESDRWMDAALANGILDEMLDPIHTCNKRL